MVYKKSLKNRMVGFRWSYAQDTNVDGFIVSFNENPLIITKNVSIIPPQKCSAWPEYYCHTFYNLTPSNNYTFKVRIALDREPISLAVNYGVHHSVKLTLRTLYVFSPWLKCNIDNTH